MSEEFDLTIPQDMAGMFKDDLEKTRKSVYSQSTRRIRVAPGGVGLFQVFEGKEKLQPIQEFVGCILDCQQTRAAYAESFDKRNVDDPKPDCRSWNGVDGIVRDHKNMKDSGEEGFDIANVKSIFKHNAKCENLKCLENCTIPRAPWEMGEDDTFNCREHRRLVVAERGSGQLYVMWVSPTSLKAVDSYMSSLAGRGAPMNGVWTRFALENGKSGGGYEVSKLVLRPVALLNEAEYLGMRESRDHFMGNGPLDVDYADSGSDGDYKVEGADDIPF